MMSRSTNGGQTWSTFRPVAGPVTQPGVLDPVQGRPVIDGIAGARSDLAIAPSVDIANGAPTGADATDRIVMTYVSGTVTAPHVYFTESTDRGATWSAPRAIESTATAASTRPRRSPRTGPMSMPRSPVDSIGLGADQVAPVVELREVNVRRGARCR